MKTPLRSASGRPCAGRLPLSLRSRLPRLQPGAPAHTLNFKVGTEVNGGNCRMTSQQPDRARCSMLWLAAAVREVGEGLHVKLWHGWEGQVAVLPAQMLSNLPSRQGLGWHRC